MSRYIDADKLKAHYGWHDKYTELTCKDFDDIVDAQPTVDTVEVVRGCWKSVCGRIARCSICKEAAVDKYRYCPNCGARMDGERKENDRNAEIVC